MSERAVDSVEKAWGETACIVKHPVFSAHHIKILPGGYCSVHRHTHRVNLFYVLSGRLTVRTWPAHGEQPQDTVLTAGERLGIPTHTYHQFRSETGAEVLEIYYPVLPQDEDIERITAGGIL